MRDLIDRQAVLDMAYDMSEIDGEHFNSPFFVVDVVDIKKLPSVTPTKEKSVKAIKELKEMRTDIWVDSRQREAIDMAIIALESYETVTEFADRCRECGKMRMGDDTK